MNYLNVDCILKQSDSTNSTSNVFLANLYSCRRLEFPIWLSCSVIQTWSCAAFFVCWPTVYRTTAVQVFVWSFELFPVTFFFSPLAKFVGKWIIKFSKHAGQRNIGRQVAFINHRHSNHFPASRLLNNHTGTTAFKRTANSKKQQHNDQQQVISCRRHYLHVSHLLRFCRST